MSNATTLPQRGKTYSGGTPDAVGKSVGIEGSPMTFKDEYKSGSGVKVVRSGRFIEARLVRNTSGINLTPGRAVTWASGYRGKRVDGYARTTAVEIAGIVDDQLPSAGVENNDLFWLLRKGPVLVKTPLAADAGNVFAAGDVLVALTAATSQATTAGRPGVLATAVSTNTALAIVNRFGRVMSAMTTAQTNTDMLVDMELM